MDGMRLSEQQTPQDDVALILHRISIALATTITRPGPHLSDDDDDDASQFGVIGMEYMGRVRTRACAESHA